MVIPQIEPHPRNLKGEAGLRYGQGSHFDGHACGGVIVPPDLA